jgi:4-alpha-glucanotransferase
MALNSRANLAVIAMQDYLELTSEQGRMNVPSRADGNWTWRVSPRYATKKLKDNIRELAITTKRAK